MDTYKKKYEEALERAKEYHSVDIDNTMDVKARGIMEYLFPELKINEDEKIRKRISHALHGDVLDFDEIIQADTWLEKQGECHISHDDEIMIKQLTEYFTTGHGLQNTNETVVEWLNDVKEKLEKQGEQKPNPCDECINVKGCINCENGELRETEQKPAVKMKTPEESLGIDSDTYNKIVNECIYGEQKSQRMISAEAKEAMYDKPADKVEPKFKVGDWVVYYRNDSSREVLQVYDIRDGRYYFTDNVHFSWSVKECDEKSHLWTIQDAKEGDVLACENGWTCIFKCLNDNLFSSYCFMDHEGWFCEDGGQGHTLDNRICGEIYPATNEQCDTLMKAMADAGYTFDFDKRELKKIEQKSAEWSEEDEKKFADACIMLDWYKGNNWWTAQYIKDWLKSLKDRYTWKPSDAQMASITCAVRKMKESACYDSELVSLLNDLKKLREE